MEDNIQNVYKKLVSFGYDGTEDEFRNYISVDSNIPNVYNKLVSFGYNGTEDEFRNYIGRVDVSDVQQAEQGNTTVAEATQIPTVTMEQMDSAEHYQPRVGGVGMKTPEELETEAQQAEPYREKPQTLTPPEVSVDNEIEDEGIRKSREKLGLSNDWGSDPFGRDKDGKPIQWNPQGRPDIVTQHEDGTKEYNFSPESVAEMNILGKYIAYQSQELAPDIAEVARKKAVDPNYQVPAELKAKIDEINQATKFYDEYEKAYKQSPFHEINEQIALKESDEALAELRGRQIASWTGAFAKTVGAGITLQGSQELAPSPLDYVFGKKFHDDMQKQSEEMRQQGEEQLGKASLLMMTAQELEQAKNTIRLSQRNQDGAGYYPRQLWYGLVYSNLTGLDQISSMSGALGLANIAEKLDENGQPKVPLTEEEQLAYDALVFNSAVQQRFGDNITMFNRIGQSMPENTAYVLDFVIGSHMGAGAVGKGASRMTKNAIGGVVKKQVKNGALRFTLDKALPTAVEMGAQATYRTMLDMPFVYSDATRRSVGTMAVDPETMQAYGFRGGEDMGAAMSDAWWARFIDNGSESLGDMVFEPGVGMVWRKVKDTQGGIKLQQARKWFGDLGNGKVDDMLRSVRNFNDQHGTGWQSAPIETLEEFSGGTMNAVFVGDQELKEVYSSENMMETALNCFIFGVAQSSTITGLKRGFADLPNDVKLRSAKREAAAVINDMDNISVEDIEQHINEDEGNALADWLYSMNNEGNWNEQQRKAVMAYTQAAIMQKARNQMRQTKMREDIEKSDAEVDASVNDRSGNVILATFKLGDETMQGTVIKGRVSTMEEPVDDGNGNVSVSYRYNPHLSSATLAVRLKDGTVKMVGSKAITSIDAIEDPETLKERWRSGIIGEVEQEIAKAATTPSISQLMGDFDFTQTGGTLSIQGQAYRFDGRDDNGNYTFTPLDEKGVADEDRKTTISEKSMRTMALLERLNAAIATNANDEEVEDIIEELKTEQELDNIEKSKDESNVWAELSQFLGKYVVLTEEGDFNPEKSDVAGAAGYLVSLKQGDINAAAAIVDERINELNMRLVEKPEGVQNNGEGVVGMAVNSNAAEGMAKQAAQAVSFLQDVRQAIGEMQQEKAEQNAEKPVSELDKGDIFHVEMNGQRYWAQVDGHTEDGPVVSLFDNERTEGEPVEAAIDNMTYEQWEAVRVAMASQQTGQEEAANTPPAEQESAGIEQKEPEITPKPLENESNPQEEISGNEGNISPVSTESSTEEAEESAQRDNVPTASQDEGQTESAPVQPEAQVEPEAQQAVELPRDKDGNIDHARLTPDDAAAYTAAVNEEADNAAAFAELGDAEYVKRNMEAAKKEVEKAEKTKPKSTGAAQLKKELADINNKRQAAKSLVAFWQAVEAEQNRRIAEAAAAQQEAEEAARREEEARRAEEARLASQGEGTTEVQPEEKKGLQGLEGYTESDVEDLVREHIESALEGMDADIEIVGVKVIGSRVNGNAREDSDLDVLVEYKGDMTEDGLFNLLNDKENRLYIEGIPVDINPITEGKSGTIEQFMARNAGYSKPTEGTAIESSEKEQNGEQANTPAAGQEGLPAVEIKEKPKRPARPSKFQKRIDAIGEPRTVEEAILLDIALGGAKFRWGNRNEDKKVMKRGIGDLWKYNNNEFKKRIGIVKKDGYSIETYAEAILAGRLMGYSGAVSQIAEGKDMRDLIDIIEDVLQMTTTKADALEALESKRAEEAEEEQRYIRAMKDAEAQEQGFENWDDKEAYQQSLEEKNLTDAEYEEYYRIFAEQTQEEDDQRRRQSESEGDSGENQPDERQGVHREHEASPEVLQGTQTDDSGAVQQPRQDTRGQSGDIHDAGTPRESEEASEVRAEIEQLRTKRADLIRQRNEIQQRYEQANGLFGDTQADENDLFGGQNFLSPDLAQATIDGYNRKIKQIDEQIAKLEASLKRAASVKQVEIEENEGVFQKPDVEFERIKALRKALAEGYSKGDKEAIQRAVDALKQYVSEGLDTETWYSEEADDYEGDDPMMQAERYITHLYQDHYLDDDEDQEYIKTGLRSDGMTKLGGAMTKDSPFYKLFEGVVDNATDGTEGTDSAVAAANAEVDTNPTEAQKEAGNYKKGHVTIDGFDISIENPAGSTRSGWYISGAFKPNRVISDAEARQVIDEYNAAHPEAPVDYDYEREGGVEFTEEDAKRVNGSNKTEAKELAYNAVREALANAGIEVEEATEEEVEKIKAEMKTLQDSKGVVRGWVGNDGKIHLTKDGLDAETPIHEYTHLWAEVLQMTNPDLWEQIKGLLKGTPEWQRITSMKEYSNLKDDDRIAGEVLAHISGKKNAERMEAEAKRMIDEAPTLEEAAKAANLLGRMRNALKKFWTWVGKTLLGRKGNINIDQVSNMVLADLTNGVDPFNPRGGKRANRTKRTDASVEGEMERIKREAQANGTFMKAPNGKPTKLKERQWLQVRTQNFKRWFGDWELAARARTILGLKAVAQKALPKGETYESLYKKIGFVTNRSDNTEVIFFNTAYNKIVKEGGLSEKAIPSLKECFEQSILAYTEAERGGGQVRPDGTTHKAHPNVSEVRNYVGKVNIDGKDCYVRFTVNVQKGQTGLHSYFVTEIDVYDKTAIGLSVSDLLGSRVTNSGIVDAKLQQFFESATEAEKNSSKIVDENGEPMVVYHGGKGEITVFDKNRIGENLDYGTMGSGFYFTSDRENAENYARNAQGEEEPTVVEAFLNIRNAKDVNWNELDGESQKKSVAFTDKAIAKGHDGFTAIAPNKAQWIVAFNPNQIKSATENNGEFDAGNDDIRFSISSVGEEQLSLFLQNNSGEYETQDGEKIGYISLLGLEDDVLSAGESNAVDGDRRNGMERGDNLPEYHLRRLEPGETCHVERRYQKSKMFDFTGSDKIETIDDVAYIFKKLEDAAVENAFIVLVKDGKPTIIHAGIGGYDYSPVNIGSALSAYKNIEPDDVWFVHNHPSGIITCSLQDRQVADNFRRVFGEKFKAGIIIDTTSGKYGVFDETIGDITNGSTRTQPENETAIDVYEFSKQVFDEDWDPTEAFKVRNSLDVATFVSSHRLGEHGKMSLLVFNNNNNVVGNIFLSYTRLGEANKEQLAEDIMYYANQMAGTKVIIYGDFLNKDIRGTGNYIKERVQRANIKLMDVVSTNEAYTEYKSAKDMGLFAFEEDSAMANEVREDIPDSSRMAVRDEFDEISGAHPKDKAKTIRQKYEQLLTDQVNKYRPLKQLEELLGKVAEKKGRKLMDTESIYSRATMTAARSLPQMEAEREIYLLPLEQAVNEVFGILDPDGKRAGRRTRQEEGGRENETMKQLRQRMADYLIAKHGLERNEWFHQQALAKDPNAQEEDKSGLRGLAESLGENPDDYKAVAERVVAEFEQEVGQQGIDNLWKELNGFTNRLLEMSYNDGFTDKDHYNDLKGRWKYYVPLRGFANGTSDDLYYYTTQGGDSAATMKKAKGRTSKADDPLTHLVRMQEKAVTAGNDNWAKQALYNAAVNLPSDLLKINHVWYTEDPNTGEIIEHYADLAGLTSPDDIDAAIKQFDADMKAAGAKRRLNKADVGKRIRPQNLGEHEIEVWVNGKKVIIEVNGNPSLVRAYSESQDELKGFIKGVQKANRLEARLFTTWNPEFAVKNMMRDTNFALFSAFVNGGVRQWKDTWANIHTARLILPKLMKDGTVSKTLVRDDSERKNLEKWYREFIDNGGETGFTRTMSAEQVSKDLNDTLRALAKGNEDGVTKMEKLAGVVEELNRWAENSTRFAAYITAREKGESVTKAMDAAKNSTLNFNIKGYEGKRLRAWFCFFNARLQGVAQLARLAKQNPKRFAIGLGAAVLTGAMVPFLNILTLGLGGDDDDWKTYEYLSEYTGNNNLVIFIPGIHKFVAIPYSQELAPFSAQGNIWFREAMGWNRNKSAWQQELEMNLAYLPMEVNLSDKEDTWPMLGSTAVRSVSPTIMQPLVEYAVNENFMNMPLRRESKYKSNLAAWTTAYESRTSGALIKASKWLNGGSSQNKWGKAEVLIDPSFIQHVVEGTAGGVGSFVGNARDLFTEPDWFNHLPFVRKFMFDGDPKKWQGGLDRAYSAYAYDFIDERDKKIDAIRYDNQSTLDYARQMWAEHNSTDKAIYDIAKDYRDNLGKYKEKVNGRWVNRSSFGENPYRYKDNGKDLLPIIGLKGMRQYYGDLKAHDADEEEIERVRGMINEYELEMLEEIDAVYYEQHVQGKKPVSESLRKMVEDARGQANTPADETE